MNTVPMRFRVQRGKGKMSAKAALLFCGFLLLSSRCSEKSTTTTQIQHTPAPPQITEIVTITQGSCSGYYTRCPIAVHYPRFGNTIGPIPVPCGSSFEADIRISGGQSPITFTASQLPAGMTLLHNGELHFEAPCSLAGQTLIAALAVTDGLGRTSPTITASFLVQSKS